MKKYIKLSFLLVAVFASVIILNGCDANADDSESGANSIYSDGIDENGYWKGVNASDYVEDFEYKGIEIPAEDHEVTDEYLQYQIDTLMAGYISRIEVTDRAIEDGDTVNIDYEGKVDDVVFEGGSTMEVGVDVLISSSNTDDAEDAEDTLSFLDDFLYQLIGKMPGDRFDIVVTFPDDYYEEELQGKEAVFDTTINYIVEREDLTDDFVKENLSATNGWTTVEEMKDGMRADIQKDFIQQYIMEFIIDEVQVTSIPDSMMEYQENILLNSYQELADYNNITIEEYLDEFEGYSSVEECLEDNRAELEENAKYFLVTQAVAEDMNFTVSDEDIATYSKEHLWSTDMSIQADFYGLPYIKQSVLIQKVIDYIAENAVLL